MKRLLVTSDDFGMCHAVNRGIARAMTEGIVRSTNLMAPCPWFLEAVELCKTHSLPAGVHLCITSEWHCLKWGPLTSAPSLRTTDGYFPSNQEDHAGRATDQDIRVEFEAQIARVRSFGIEPTHLDTHMLSSVGRSLHGDCVRAIVRRLSVKHDFPTPTNVCRRTTAATARFAISPESSRCPRSRTVWCGAPSRAGPSPARTT